MIEILPIQSEYICGMVEVEEQCFASGYAKATFERELENKIAVYKVAVDNGKVLGYAGLWNICGEADIIDVAVHSEFRRKGIACALISALIEECRKLKITAINLEVRVSNLAARELYQKLGFVEVGLRKRYYENTEDAILMQKILVEEG